MHPNMIKIKLWKDVFSKAINALNTGTKKDALQTYNMKKYIV